MDNDYTLEQAKAAFESGEHIINIAWRFGGSTDAIRELAAEHKWVAPPTWDEIAPPTWDEIEARIHTQHTSATAKEIRKARVTNERAAKKQAAKDKKEAIATRKSTRAANTAAHKVVHAAKIEARANMLVAKQAFDIHPKDNGEVLSDKVLLVLDEVSLPNELITAAAHAQVKIGYRKLADRSLALVSEYLVMLGSPELVFLPHKVDCLKKLTETLKIAIGLSMQAYGMADNSNGAADAPTEPTMSDNEIARRVAFVMARAQAIDVTPTEDSTNVK